MLPFSLEFNTINFFGVVLVAYLCNLFAVWSVHFIFHRKILGISFYKIHLNSHHRIKPLPDAQAFYWATIEHMASGLFLIFYLVLYYLLFSNWIALTFIIEGIFIVALTYYLHNEYDKSKSWLKQYSWFKRDRKLHHIHHSHFNDRFVKSKNYSFGGVTGYFIDHLFGTFQDINTTNLKTTEE